MNVSYDNEVCEFKLELENDDIVDYIYRISDEDYCEIINKLGKKFKNNRNQDFNLKSLIDLIKEPDDFYLDSDGEWFLNECKKILKE